MTSTPATPASSASRGPPASTLDPMSLADANRTPTGYPAGTMTGGIRGGLIVDDLELNPDLRHPYAPVVFDRMRTEEGQLVSVIRALTLPLFATGRRLVGGRKIVRDQAEAELGLNVKRGKGRAQRQPGTGGIVFDQHLREAILYLWFGWGAFEQTYTVGPAFPGLEDPDQPGKLYAHLDELGYRAPRTVEYLNVDDRGHLKSIIQQPRGIIGQSDPLGREILAENLVVYVNDREGADYTGRSLLRACYGPWLIKDALTRLGAQIVERNGMGIPFVSYTDPKDKTYAHQLARSLRAGAEAGGALPPGVTVALVGVTGSTYDPLPQIKHHDEAMGRTLLAMFLNLGHDNGARALGATFLDVFLNSGNSVLRYVEDVITNDVLARWVLLNYGPDEEVPVLEFDDLDAEATPTAESLKALADAGLITGDDPTEADLRRRYKLPPADPSTRRTPPAPAPTAPPAAGDTLPGDPAPGAVPPNDGVVEELPVTQGDGAVTVREHQRPASGVTVREHERRAPGTTAATAGEDLLDRIEDVVAKLAVLRAG